MKTPFKFTNAFMLALLLIAIGCSNDDEGTAPNVISVQDLEITIVENPTNGQVVGTVVVTQTVGGATLAYSITSQTPTDALNIVAATGELTIADAALFDFEINPTITAAISVDGAENTGTVTISLTNENELSVQDFTVTIDENPIDGQAIGEIQATGDGTLSFSITSQTPAGALNVNATTGELTVADPNLFDFETNPVITADILVDNSGNTETVIATITLNDLDEVSAQNLNVAIDENPINGQVVGTIPATGGNLVFTITFQNPAGAFNIDASTGELTVADATLFDFETNPNMLATVSVENSVNMVSVNATVSLNDKHEVGEFKYGGVIFWIDPASNNSAGLVVDINDMVSPNAPQGIAWDEGTIMVTGATGTDIGTGEANTSAIVANYLSGTYAAWLCAAYQLNGYTDWYLPSKDELNQMYLNRIIVNASSLANGGTAFSNSFYWSSSEFNSANAENQDFTNGSQAITGKFIFRNVRAIRSWTDF